MQIGTSTNEVAWEFKDGTGFDQEMLDWYRTYTRLHLRLFPYEWTYAQRIAVDGRPIQRALGLAYPEMGVHPNDIYLFGDDLLVDPLPQPGEGPRSLLQRALRLDIPAELLGADGLPDAAGRPTNAEDHRGALWAASLRHSRARLKLHQEQTEVEDVRLGAED